ncbi:MAG: ABC transporter permease [Gammaproteobacteria bacterium]|nr:ABC transporter permease [Gammaproteobacteria bacterium]
MSNKILFDLILTATGETLYMSFSATFLAAIFGILLGVILFVTRKGQFLENKYINLPLGIIVNIGRSIPFIILVVIIIPFTAFIAGKSYGNTAAIIPLTVSAIPFFARLTENVLLEVPQGLIEAAQAMGASPLQIIYKVLLPEAKPGLVNAVTVTAIALIGYSAMAGMLGAGGLGNVAIVHGYQQWNNAIMFYTVAVIVVIVQSVQTFGDWLSKKLNHK